ncbi:hypothetical protein JVX88_03335 [Leptolyngbya sp. 7M]|nr:hypothetical protein JVX88_03335 [Leptolyngbya sp. 7M]
MAWFRRDKPKIEGAASDEERTVNTSGIFVKCPDCDNPLYRGELVESQQVCLHCNYHFRYPARLRLETLFDNGEYEKLDEEVTSTDPLGFVDSRPYSERIEAAKESSGLPEAIVSGKIFPVELLTDTDLVGSAGPVKTTPG